MSLLRVDLSLRPASRLLVRRPPRDGALTVVGSDTLWAGLMNCAGEEGGPEAAERLKTWARQGRVRLSSLFPRVVVEADGVRADLLLYAQPLLSMTSHGCVAPAIKRRRFFVAQGVLETMLDAVVQTESGLRTQVAFGDADVLRLFDEALASVTDFQSFPEPLRDRVLHAALSLEAPPFLLRPCATVPGFFELFGDEKIVSPSGNGRVCFFGAFFFLLKADDEIRDACATWIRLLAEAGVGKGRRSGRGAFGNVEIRPHAIAVRSSDGDFFTSLSVTAPSAEETGHIVAGDLVERRFTLPEDGRTWELAMLAEGSVFRRGVQGRIVTIGGAVERFGFAFPVPFGAVR